MNNISADMEDYIPVNDWVSSENGQLCVNIHINNDSVVEEDEIFAVGVLNEIMNVSYVHIIIRGNSKYIMHTKNPPCNYYEVCSLYSYSIFTIHNADPCSYHTSAY